jgi:hypothetical protein
MDAFANNIKVIKEKASLEGFFFVAPRVPQLLLLF